MSDGIKNVFIVSQWTFSCIIYCVIMDFVVSFPGLRSKVCIENMTLPPVILIFPVDCPIRGWGITSRQSGHRKPLEANGTELWDDLGLGWTDSEGRLMLSGITRSQKTRTYGLTVCEDILSTNLRKKRQRKN